MAADAWWAAAGGAGGARGARAVSLPAYLPDGMTRYQVVK